MKPTTAGKRPSFVCVTVAGVGRVPLSVRFDCGLSEILVTSAASLLVSSGQSSGPRSHHPSLLACILDPGAHPGSCRHHAELAERASGLALSSLPESSGFHCVVHRAPGAGLRWTEKGMRTRSGVVGGGGHQEHPRHRALGSWGRGNTLGTGMPWVSGRLSG